MSEPAPARADSESLADVVEMLLDKGVVINADIAVAVGDTELLAIQIRAALASFETAAEYGLQFPDGTDMQRVAEASGRSSVTDRDPDRDRPPGLADDDASGDAQPAVTAADREHGASDDAANDEGSRSGPTADSEAVGDTETAVEGGADGDR